MTLLTKSAILSAVDLKTEDVHVPAWGGTVRIRTMTGAERDEFHAARAAEGAESVPFSRFSALLLVVACVDASGNRLFTQEDIAALQAKAAASLDAPTAVAMRLNGFGRAALEQAEKNYASSQSDDSGSA